MHEARSKDELYRKIYHEPERNIGVLRVKLMHSPLFLFFASYTYGIMRKRIICINRDLGWSEKGGEHVGFECG